MSDTAVIIEMAHEVIDLINRTGEFSQCTIGDSGPLFLTMRVRRRDRTIAYVNLKESGEVTITALERDHKGSLADPGVNQWVVDTLKAEIPAFDKRYPVPLD
jgi:hypothetical protein